MNSIQLQTSDPWNAAGAINPFGGGVHGVGAPERPPRSQVDRQEKPDVNCPHCGQQLGACQCNGVEPRYREGTASMPGREAAGMGPIRGAGETLPQTDQPADHPPRGTAAQAPPPPPPDEPRTAHKAVDLAARMSAGGDETTPRTTGAGGMRELSVEEQAQLQQLKERDSEVRAHEQAHIAASGGNAGGAHYTYQVGPDGRRYAVGGSVHIDTSPVAGDPEATIRKAQQVRRAALAPSQPSGQDRAVAASAAQMETEARVEQKEEEATEARGEHGAANGASGAMSAEQAGDAAPAATNASEAGRDLAEEGAAGRRTRTTDWERALNAYAAAEVSTSAPATPTAVNVDEALDAMQARRADGRTGYGVPTGQNDPYRLDTAI